MLNELIAYNGSGLVFETLQVGKERDYLGKSVRELIELLGLKAQLADRVPVLLRDKVLTSGPMYRADARRLEVRILSKELIKCRVGRTSLTKGAKEVSALLFCACNERGIDRDDLLEQVLEVRKRARSLLNE